VYPDENHELNPSATVEAKARIALGCGVELDGPHPISWVPNRIYKLRTAIALPALNRFERATTAGVQEVRAYMTMRYSTIRKMLQSILVPLTSAANDVVNGWWKAVDPQHVRDLNILCLSRDWNGYDIGHEDDNPIDISEGMEISEGMAITWDGFDAKGVTLFRLTLDANVRREEPRSYLLRWWIEHYKTHPEHAEIASQLFTDDNEYYCLMRLAPGATSFF
jgi:hypothetical protein